MGGRGASLGISVKGKKYGTEFKTLLNVGNIKFVKHNDSAASKTPMETMSKGRVYVTVNNKDELKSITFYDNNNKRYKQIDLTGKAHAINGKYVLPHVHMGYTHNEYGDYVRVNQTKKLLILLIK